MSVEALRAKLLKVLEVYLYAAIPFVVYLAWSSGTSIALYAGIMTATVLIASFAVRQHDGMVGRVVMALALVAAPIVQAAAAQGHELQLDLHFSSW